MALQEEAERQGNWLFKYRSYLPLLILVAGLIVYWTNIPIDGEALQQPASYYNGGVLNDMTAKTSVPNEQLRLGTMLCLIVSLVGLTIRIYTVGYTPQGTSGRNTAEGQVAAMLNTTGIYSVVRHPLYLGNFFMWLGVCLLTYHVWFCIVFCLLYWIYYERIMFAEEQFLRRKFGTEYLNWASVTPAFFPICHKKSNNKADLSTESKQIQQAKEERPLLLSWKKILRQEKDGFMALFAVFALFDIVYLLKQAVWGGYPVYEGIAIAFQRFAAPRWEFIAFVFAFVVYCVLKFLKNKTTILN